MPVLALAKQFDCRRIVRIAGQVKTARSLDGDYFAGAQQLVGIADDIARDRVAVSVKQRDLRPAFRTTIAFGMQAVIFRAQILCLAFTAHGKWLEARTRPVVGQAATDRVARAAMNAVGEGIAPAAAFRVEHVTQAITADHRILTDHRAGPPAPAVENVEVFRDGDRLREARGDRVDARKGRRILVQALCQALDVFVKAADFDFDTLGVIANPTGQLQFLGQAQNEGAQANALHDTT